MHQKCNSLEKNTITYVKGMLESDFQRQCNW